MVTANIGVIGGSGLYQMDLLEGVEEVTLDTPFGSPSDDFLLGEIAGTTVAFLARHGRGHRYLPSEIPFRANIYAMKQLGIEYLISASAIGSLQENVKPLDIVLPDQFIDRTRHRISTFFGDGIVAHIAFAEPVCSQLSGVLADAIAALELPGVTLHRGGTYVCIEGPAFSTKAESHLYRSWGATAIGMTNLPEAKLAREAEIAYATLALVTDYDCWHPEHDSVTVATVIENLQRNAANAQKIIAETVQRLAENPFVSEAHSALKFALLSDLDRVSEESKAKLAPILAKYSDSDSPEDDR